MLQKMYIRCGNVSIGCEAIVKLEDLDRHERNCPHVQLENLKKEIMRLNNNNCPNPMVMVEAVETTPDTTLNSPFVNKEGPLTESVAVSLAFVFVWTTTNKYSTFF